MQTNDLTKINTFLQNLNENGISDSILNKFKLPDTTDNGGWKISAAAINDINKRVMTSPDEKREETRRPAIYISSSPIDFLSKTGAESSIDGTSEAYKNSRLPLSTTLEAFKENRLAFITEKNIGPKLRVSTKKSRLAKHDA
jgi:hypothetical protein